MRYLYYCKRLGDKYMLSNENGFSYIELIVVISIISLLVKEMIITMGACLYPIELQKAVYNLMYVIESIQQETMYGKKFNSEKKPILELRKNAYKIRRKGYGQDSCNWIYFPVGIKNEWNVNHEIKFDKYGSPEGCDSIVLSGNNKYIKLIIAEMTGRITIER